MGTRTLLFARPLLAPLLMLAGAAAPRALDGDDRTAPTAEDRRRDLQRIEALLADLPRDTFDPQAIVDRVGRDPEALLAWVRDQTCEIACRGVLRGPVGVLMDRQGGSLDRSLLLVALLEKAGHAARLAFAERSAAAGAPLPAPRDPAVEAAVAAGDLDPRSLDPWAERARRESEANLRRMRDDARAQLAVLTDALGAAPAIASADADADADADEGGSAPRSEPGRRWWVEHEANGTWIALDPALPDAKPGSAPTIAPPSDHRSCALSEIPADEFHEVDVAVVIEKHDGSRFAETEVFRATLRPSERLGERITLAFVPLDVPNDATFAPDACEELARLAAGQRRWVPIVQIGEQTIVRRGFTDRGELLEPPFAGTVAAVAEGATALGGRVSGLFGGARAGTRLTSVWLDYELRTPGRATRTIRRPLLDLVGPAARSDGAAPGAEASDEDRRSTTRALLGRTEIVLQNCRLSPPFVLARLAGAITSHATELVEAGEQERAHVVDRALASVPGRAALLAMARFECSEVAGQVCLDATNVLNHRLRFVADAAGAWTPLESFDLVDNEIGVLPGADPWRTRLAQGVADTAAEGRLLSDRSSDAGTCGIISTAIGNGIELRTLRTPAELDAARLSAPADVLRRIASDLREGRIVVVPAQAVEVARAKRLAWWRVDPRSGSVLGVLDSGHHGATRGWSRAALLFQDGGEKTGIESTAAWREFMKIAPFINNGNRALQAGIVSDILYYAERMAYSPEECQALANAMGRFFGWPL